MGRRRIHDRHLPERMHLRGPSYYFIQYGSNRWINLGRDYVQAMAEYAELTSRDTPCRTIGDLIDRYLREIAPKKAPRTYQGNIQEAKRLRACFGSTPIASVTTQHIYQYLDERGKTAPVRANREIALLSHMFTKAERWGQINHSQNPCVRIERLPEHPRDRYIEDAEFVAFREHAGPLIAAYMDVKYLTGLRQADLLSIRLDQLKEDGIHLKVSKNGKRIIIAWNEPLRAAVQRARSLPRPVRGLFLFCNRRGQPYTGSGFRSNWHRQMRSALKNGVLQERFREHDIRAKSASDTSRDQASELLAHLDARTTQKYYRRKPEIVRPLGRILEESENIRKRRP